jgi:hypothetical protein
MDAQAPPLRARISEAIGMPHFVPTMVTFPSTGCWQVTGTVGHDSITFVTEVVRLGTAARASNWPEKSSVISVVK